ncbi:MAG: signal transduction histidine kinase [Planctomycetota bacterium]|nr:signal transduction histidine kinase [Planctomycetota bacterium]
MRRSIRSQILIPLVTVQVAAVAVLAFLAASVATRRAEAQAVDRLNAVIGTLGRSSFPVTPAVLEAMRGLSGAHFIAFSHEGAILESTIRGLSDLPEALRAVPRRANLDLPGRSPTLVVAGSHYFAAAVQSSGGPGRAILVVLYPEAAWRQARWDAAMPPVAVGLLALAAMVGVTGVVAHRLGNRLRSLEGKTAAIADGDFRPLEILTDSSGDELQDLTDAINRMCSHLRSMQETIRRTERAGVLAQLAAGLAHQLRNASTGARMALQLHARRCPIGTEEGSLDVALRQLALGEAQVKALLSLGRPDRSIPVPLDAAQIVAEVSSLVEPTCRHAKVEFVHDGPDGLTITADPEALRGAVLNLTLNAIEAAGPGGIVELVAYSHGSSVNFDVLDNGPGPSTQLGDSLFEAFVTTKPEGVGLGLAVARQVAAEHRGSLGWSRDAGRTIFRLELPRLITIPPDPQALPRSSNSERMQVVDRVQPARGSA